MKDFILTWYKELIALFFLVLEFIFSIVLLIKKNKKVSPLLLDLIQLLPKYILAAEKLIGSGNGETKRDYVLQLVSDEYYRLTGQKIDNSTFCIVSKAIEHILSAPQKKGIRND